MAGFPEFLVAWIKTQAVDLLPLLGGAGNLRVSPWQAIRKDPQPRITYTLISGIEGGVVRDLIGPEGVARERWQLDCWGDSPSQSQQLAGYLLGASGDRRLDGYRGTLGGVTMLATTLLDKRDNSNTLGPGTDMGNPCVSLDFGVAFRVNSVLSASVLADSDTVGLTDSGGNLLVGN